MSQTSSSRQHDVDWLRVLAFIALIFYHIAMFYVADWGWHVKSHYQSAFLQNIMLLFNQWRMPLIFFISGLVLAIIEVKISAWQLLKIRFLRIVVPLLIGMYFIVPPQSYFEAVQNYSYAGNYWLFLLEYINPDSLLLPEMHHEPTALLTWNHLWYLAYLWHYTLVYLLIRPMLKIISTRLSNHAISALLIFIVPVILLTIYGLALKPNFPKTNALFDDWYNHAVYFSVFIFGYLTAKSPLSWKVMIVKRRVWLVGAIIGYMGIMVLHNELIKMPEDIWIVDILIQLWVYSNVWAWMLCVVAFGGAYLNKPSSTLNYLNEAILPWYILHQTAIIIIAMQLSPLLLGGVIEPIVLIIATFVCCALLYEVIRRVWLLRLAFGMKLKSTN